MKVMESCLYNQAVLCGGAVDRLTHCWECTCNPEVQHRKKQAAYKQREKNSLKNRKNIKKQPANKTAGHKEVRVAHYEERINWDKGRELYDIGLTDLEISIRLKCARDTVAKWRRKNGLLSNGSHGKKHV